MSDFVTTIEPVTADEFATLMRDFSVLRGARIAVAVSGGADSVALARLLAGWADARGVALSALTVDHGLRAHARDEARQVARWLSPLGIDHVTLTWDAGAACQTAVQARARNARYELMSRWCRAHGIDHLFVAHHLGDQAETVLMRLKRATTLFGLAAMSKRSERLGVTLCRPLLGLDKARLVATLRICGQDWIEDPSNSNPDFERVRVRGLLKHLQNEGVSAPCLGRVADAARRVSDIVDRAAHAFIRQACEQAAKGSLHIDADAFAQLPQAVRERVLVHVLVQFGPPTPYGPSPAKVSRLGHWMMQRGAHGPSARTLAGCRVGHSGAHFILTPEGPRKSGKNSANSLFFTAAPLPEGGKRLTSRETGVHDKA